MIALSADPSADGIKVATEMKLTYPILSDAQRNYLRAYGVLHPQEGIARPSLFIINKEGKIVWKYIGMDAADRPAMNTIFGQLDVIK